MRTTRETEALAKLIIESNKDVVWAVLKALGKHRDPEQDCESLMSAVEDVGRMRWERIKESE